MHRLAVSEAVGQLTAADFAAMRAANERFAAALRRGMSTPRSPPTTNCTPSRWRRPRTRALETVLDQFTPLLRRVERLRFSSVTGRGSVALHDRLIDLCEAGDTEAAAASPRRPGRPWNHCSTRLDRSTTSDDAAPRRTDKPTHHEETPCRSTTSPATR